MVELVSDLTKEEHALRTADGSGADPPPVYKPAQQACHMQIKRVEVRAVRGEGLSCRQEYRWGGVRSGLGGGGHSIVLVCVHPRRAALRA